MIDNRMVDGVWGPCRFFCDYCEFEFPHSGEFQEVLGKIKLEDWMVVFAEGEWKHYCPDCTYNSDMSEESKR